MPCTPNHCHLRHGLTVARYPNGPPVEVERDGGDVVDVRVTHRLFAGGGGRARSACRRDGRSPRARAGPRMVIPAERRSTGWCSRPGLGEIDTSVEKFLDRRSWTDAELAMVDPLLDPVDPCLAGAVVRHFEESTVPARPRRWPVQHPRTVMRGFSTKTYSCSVRPRPPPVLHVRGVRRGDEDPVEVGIRRRRSKGLAGAHPEPGGESMTGFEQDARRATMDTWRDQSE